MKQKLTKAKRHEIYKKAYEALNNIKQIENKWHQKVICWQLISRHPLYNEFNWDDGDIVNSFTEFLWFKPEDTDIHSAWFPQDTYGEGFEMRLTVLELLIEMTKPQSI